MLKGDESALDGAGRQEWCTWVLESLQSSGRASGWLHEDWQDSEGTRGHKYWRMGSEARKIVADHVKEKGGAMRDQKTWLHLRLDNGRRHGVYGVCEYVKLNSTPNCVVCMCMFVCVIIGQVEHHIP